MCGPRGRQDGLPSTHPTRPHRCGCGALVGGCGGVQGPPRRGHGLAKCPGGGRRDVRGLALGSAHGAFQGPKTPRGPLPRSSSAPSDLGFCGAPGRIRTCGRRIRSPVLYPLSYGCSIQLSPTAAEHGPGPSLLPGECCVPKRGGACWGSYGRKVPCRGTSGVPGRHSRVFGRCRPQ